MTQWVTSSSSVACLLALFVFVFTWSWACWLLAPALKMYSPAASIELTLAACMGPSLAAVVVVGFSLGRKCLRRWLLMCLYAISVIASSVLFSWLFNLRPFQVVVGIQVLAGMVLLFRRNRQRAHVAIGE